MEDPNDDPEPESEAEAHFYTTFNGVVESVELNAHSRERSVVLRYDIVTGTGWNPLGGLCGALSQTAEIEYGDAFVMNLPIDVTYRSSSPFGWPQLVISVYGKNFWGSEAIIGYGRTHFPTTHGIRKTRIPLFAPKSSTPFGDFMSWLTGKNPELTNPCIIAEGNDNYLLRTSSYGRVNITMNLISKGLKDLDYDNAPL